MISYTRQDLECALRDVGIHSGNTVLLSVQLSPLGRLEEAKDRVSFLRIYADTLWQVLGPDGTLVVPNLQIYVPARPLLTGEALDVDLAMYIGSAAVQSIAWAVGLLAAASFIFRRRDFL